MLADAFKYPLADDESARTFLIGSLLVVGSVLVVPAFVLLGFFIRAVGNAAENRGPPRFEDYGGLFVDGLKLTGVGAAYLVGFILVAGLVSLAGSINETAGTIGFLIIAPVYFGLIYAMASIIYQYCRRRRMRDAFDFRAVADTALSLRYLLVAVLWLIVLPTLFTVAQLLVAVTIVGILLVPAMLVYETLVYAKLIGDLADPTESRGEEASQQDIGSAE